MYRAGCNADPCSVNNPCGEGAQCENSRGRPVCSCPPGHAGDPYVRCVRGNISATIFYTFKPSQIEKHFNSH